ncbi:MAG: enoyl-CoA hydratase/isomerase family protein [Thermodesulfobacteriota bacterium]|nr:enoyl-CoA hydratase/isomerase family protein [Thermodesulfobacteriota bacterium]
MKETLLSCATFTGAIEPPLAFLDFHRNFLLGTENLKARDQVIDFLGTIAADDAIKVLLVTGSPESNGQEEFVAFFSRFYERNRDITLIHRMFNVISQLVLTLATMKTFVIYVNSGSVLASHLNIGLACDYRILAEDTTIQNPCIDLGIVSKGGAGFFMPRLIGPARTAEVMLSSEDISGREAWDIGLVNEVVPADELAGTATKRAMAFAEKPAGCLTAVKRFINFNARDLQKYLEMENETLIHLVR